MIIALTPDIEQALTAEAHRLGLTPAQRALESLRERGERWVSRRGSASPGRLPPRAYSCLTQQRTRPRRGPSVRTQWTQVYYGSYGTASAATAMTLTDTGALGALPDADDLSHDTYAAAARRLPAGPLLTTWVCCTETMSLFGAVGGYRYQVALWALRATGRLVLHDLASAEADRMATLVAQYQGTPMDLADASLVVVAESRALHRVCTIDSDCYVYRLADGSALEVVP